MRMDCDNCIHHCIKEDIDCCDIDKKTLIAKIMNQLKQMTMLIFYLDFLDNIPIVSGNPSKPDIINLRRKLE